MNTLQNLLTNRKAYLAVAGSAGLCIWQLSQADYAGAIGSAVATATMLGLKLSPPAQEAAPPRRAWH